MNWIILSLPLVLMLIAASYWLLRRATRQSTWLPITANWIEDLSIERYRPMTRLLAKEDLEFLREQPGFSRKAERRFRVQRCQIFRGYLDWLNQDFNQVLKALKLVLIQSSQDRPDLAGALLRQQMQFAVGMADARARMLLYRCGFSGVDVTDLMRSFDNMRAELQQLVPVSADLRS
jgi:hypothetical protein